MIIETRLTACENVIPNVVSTYKWKDEIHSGSKDYLLWIDQQTNQQSIDTR